MIGSGGRGAGNRARRAGIDLLQRGMPGLRQTFRPRHTGKITGREKGD